MSLMGVDVGTTGVKAVVFGEGGRVLSTAYDEYPLLFPFPKAAELDSERVVGAALHVIGSAAEKVRNSDPVQAIGITSQGEAFTPVSHNGAYLGNGMTSSDSRAASLVDGWTSEFGKERLYRITGHTSYPMYTLFKLLWLRENQSDIWDRTWKFLFYQDLVAYALTGETKTDPSMAARSMLFDIHTGQWSTEICNSVGLSTDRLPDVVPSGAAIGRVREKAAEEIGIPPGVSVSICGHDQPVGAFGAGAAKPGLASYSIGTVECICPCTDRMVLEPKMMEANLATYPHVATGCYTTVAFNITGGSMLRWLRDSLFPELRREAEQRGLDPYDHLTSFATGVPANVLVLPHWSGTGTPHFDPYGAGTVFGLKLNTSRGELVQAFLEGITLEMRLNLSILKEAGLEVTELRAIGGGAKSKVWMQIKADILGMPISTVQVSEATCMGAAILAGQGFGLHDAMEAVDSWTRPVRQYWPRTEHGAAYGKRLGIYEEIYGALSKGRCMLHELEER